MHLVKVVANRPSFRRAGREWTKEPTYAALGEEEFETVSAEPMLTVIGIEAAEFKEATGIDPAELTKEAAGAKGRGSKAK